MPWHLKKLKIAHKSYLRQSREAVFFTHGRRGTVRESFLAGAVMETYLTIEELAGYLKLAEQTIRRWVLNRELPFHKIKKVIRFRVSEIEKWVDNNGYEFAEERNDYIEGDLFKDAISLDELSEMEQAEEGSETGDEA